MRMVKIVKFIFKKKYIIGICVIILFIIAVAGVCFQLLSNSRMRMYQTYSYEMIYDSQICYPTYLNDGSCEKMSGEVWQFYGYDNQDIYVDSYLNLQENNFYKVYVPKGIPIVAVVDQLWHTYDWNYHEYETMDEILEAAGEYFECMINEGGNSVINEINSREEITFELKDGSVAKVKVLENECKIPSQNQWECVFCQFSNENKKLKEKIQTMYESFKCRKAGNIILEENDIEKICNIQVASYLTWNDKVIQYDNHKWEEVEKEYLLYMPMNEITKEKYDIAKEYALEHKCDVAIEIYKIEMKGGEKRQFVVYRTEGYSYTFYDNKYYIITNDWIYL